MDTDILVGVDGSGNSQSALRWAVEEARTRGVRVRAILCWSFLGLADSGQGVGTTEGHALEALEKAVADVVGDESDMVDLVTVNDLPVPGILAQAATSNLVVVGSRGRGGVKGLVLGSVSRTVVERSPIPVVVVPPDK